MNGGVLSGFLTIIMMTRLGHWQTRDHLKILRSFVLDITDYAGLRVEVSILITLFQLVFVYFLMK